MNYHEGMRHRLKSLGFDKLHITPVEGGILVEATGPDKFVSANLHGEHEETNSTPINLRAENIARWIGRTA